MKKCIICDIDGVYVDSSKWIPFIPASREDREGWNRFAQQVSLCTPNFEIINLLRLLAIFFPIIFITSREDSRLLKAATEGQIKVFSENSIQIGDKHKLYMRTFGDYRDSHQVKKDIMTTKVLTEYDPLLAIDDEIDNILMYKNLGILTWYYTRLRR